MRDYFVTFDRRTFTTSTALVFGTLLVFSRAVGNDFLNYDDPVYVTRIHMCRPV
jgi:hypothetical protein